MGIYIYPLYNFQWKSFILVGILGYAALCIIDLALFASSLPHIDLHVAYWFLPIGAAFSRCARQVLLGRWALLRGRAAIWEGGPYTVWMWLWKQMLEVTANELYNLSGKDNERERERKRGIKHMPAVTQIKRDCKSCLTCVIFVLIVLSFALTYVYMMVVLNKACCHR